MKRLEKEWNIYRLAVYPHGAGEGQLIECRRAFYAGATAFYGLMMRGMSPGPDETPEDIDYLKQLAQEMFDFNQRVVRGDA